MKNLTICILCMFSSALSSQVISADWLFSIGDSSRFERREIRDIFNPRLGGVDLTWDFSTVDIGVNTENYTIQYNDPEEFGANAFSQTATIASVNSLGDRQFRYFELSGDDLLYHGDSMMAGSKRVYEPPIVQFSFPLEFDQEIINFTTLDFFDNLGNLGFENEADVSRKIDGIGTLITPYDTFTNCIRVKEEFIAQPQSSTPLRSETYSWYYNKLSNEMMRIFINYNLRVSLVEWQTNLNETLTNTQETVKEKPLVQHLRNNDFRVENISGRYSITVFDVLGRQIESDIIEFDERGTSFELAQTLEMPQVHFMLFVKLETNDFFVHKFIP